MKTTYYAKKERRLKVRPVLYFFLLIATMAVGYYALLNNDFLKLEKISVVDGSGADRGDLLGLIEANVKSSFLGDLFPDDNLLHWLFVNYGNLTGFQSLDLKRGFFSNSLVFIVSEYDKFGIWCFVKDEQCYWFNGDGLLFSEAPSIEGRLLIKIFDVDNQKGEVSAIDMLLVKFSERVIKIISDFSLTAERVEYSESAEEIHYFLNNGTKLIFSAKDGLNDGLLSYLKSLLGDAKTRPEKYIDFSVKNRIYVK